MAKHFDLNGKVALVTGGARGIGFATARSSPAAAPRSSSSTSTRRRGRGRRRVPARRRRSASPPTSPTAARCSAVVAEAVERFGGLDVVVANAGIASRGATARAMSGETFDRVLDVNLNGVHRTVIAALPEIVRRRGHVVVVASVYAFINGVGAAPYAMSKAGVEQFGRALRVELAQHGAGASVAYFGFIDTEMVHQAIDADPLGRARLGLAPARSCGSACSPRAAGKAIVDGIEKRAPRIIRPRRWAVFSVLRGVLNPLIDA